MNISIKKIQLFLLVFFLCVGQIVFAQDIQKISFKGNSFEMLTKPRDTFYIENIETGQREMKVTSIEVIPIKMNGANIANGDEMQSPPLPERSMDEYFIELVNQNKTLFNQLPDGQYRINPRHFVVNQEGKIMYYTFEGIEPVNPKQQKADAQNSKTILEINQLVKDFINSGKILFEAGEQDGNKILGMANGAHVWITVMNHLVTVNI